MSVHSLNSGAAIAIGGNVVVERMIARIRNLNLKRSRASAYAAKEPIVSAINVEQPETIALVFKAVVKSAFLKIEV